MSEEWCVRVVTFSLYNYIEVTISTVNTNEVILMDSKNRWIIRSQRCHNIIYIFVER